MQKLFAWMIAIACVVTVVGCSRGLSPTAPARGTSQNSSPQDAALKATAIEIGGGSLSGPLVAGNTMQLRALARLVDGSTTDVSSLASWTSDDPAVASVDSSGLVTARRRGAGRVRATLQNLTGETAFDVVDRADPAPPPGPTSDPASPGGSSLPPSPGQPPSSPGSGSGSDSLPGGTPTVQRITITGDHTVPTGKSAQFRATAHMSDGSQKDVTSDANWRSENSLIGSMSQSGVLTGVAPGSNVVSAEYGGASASQPVQVTPL